MSAFGDLLTALMPFGGFVNARAKDHILARAALRKYAPCPRCDGDGKSHVDDDKACYECAGIGWTPASVESVIERHNDALSAARDVVEVRDALDKRRLAEPNPDNREDGVPFEVDAAIDYLGDCLVDVS